MNTSLSQELERLASHTSHACVSIYMPTHRAGPETTRECPIRLKNLLGQAEEGLIAQGMRAPEARDLLREGRRLQEDPLFWQHQQEGLALFLAPGLLRDLRLPLRFEELVVTGDRFHLKPLLPLLDGDGKIYVLTLSQKGVGLYQGSRHSLRELEADALPTSLAAALRFGALEKQLRLHEANASRSTSGPATQLPGPGVGIDDTKGRILRYFRRINDGIWEMLREEKAPLILAGVEYYFPIYREVNTYPALMEQGISGSPETLKLDELHRRAWTIVEPHFQRARDRDHELVQQAQKAGRTITRVEEAVRAALEGKVAALFVADGVQCWGQLDPDGQEPRIHEQPEPGDQDLLDLTAVQTFLRGGAVHAVPREQMPAQADLAALLRY